VNNGYSLVKVYCMQYLEHTWSKNLFVFRYSKFNWIFCVCVSVCLCILFISIDLRILLYVFVYTYVCLDLMFICNILNICVFIYKHTHIYIYIYIHADRCIYDCPPQIWQPYLGPHSKHLLILLVKSRKDL
jgi:hypothetical protein